MLKLPYSLTVLCSAALLNGLTTFRTLAQSIVIPVETRNNLLLLAVDPHKDLHMAYFGPGLSNKSEYEDILHVYRQKDDDAILFNSAYTPSGSRNLLEPAISVTHADGNLSLDLRYTRHTITTLSPDISLLSVFLKDPVYNFEVTLYYKSYYKENMIEQWSTIKHTEAGNVALHKYASANLTLNADSYWLRQYHGNWAMEMQPEETQLTHGIKTLDSKLGTRANLYEPSVFMLSLDKPASEDEGTVLYGGTDGAEISGRTSK